MIRSVQMVLFAVAVAALGAGCGSSNSSGSSSNPASPSSSASTGTPVSIVQGATRLTTTAYSPNPLTISRGTSVTFTNNDSITHTATASGTFDTGAISPGSSQTVTLQSAGTVTYRCTIHPGMTGTIIVQ